MTRLTAATWSAWIVSIAAAGAGCWGLVALRRAHMTAPAAATAALPQAAPAEQPTRGHHWQDPSIAPDVLAKAFAPPPDDLPLAARPVKPNISPPKNWSSRAGHRAY